MLRPALTALLLAASLPVAAESLNYNIVEFSESANMEVPRGYHDRAFQHQRRRQRPSSRQPSLHEKNLTSSTKSPKTANLKPS